MSAVGVKIALGDTSAPQAPVPAVRTEVVVADVLDGDTLRVRTPGGRDLGRVRLLGIDAPEIAHSPTPADCYGDSATELLADLAPIGGTVWLVSDQTQDDRDVYGRLLRYVQADGGDVGRQLLRQGAARLYDADPPIVRVDEYQAAAAAAHSEWLGLWGAC